MKSVSLSALSKLLPSQAIAYGAVLGLLKESVTVEEKPACL